MDSDERTAWRDAVRLANRYGHEGKRVVFVDGFAEFLSEALGLVGKLPREELVAVFSDERLDARVTQQYTDPRLGVAGALLDGRVGEPHRFERGELVVTGGDFLGGTLEVFAIATIIFYCWGEVNGGGALLREPVNGICVTR